MPTAPDAAACGASSSWRRARSARPHRCWRGRGPPRRAKARPRRQGGSWSSASPPLSALPTWDWRRPLGFRRMSDEVVALFGPTGVGKTDVAVALADLLRVRGERPIAISADALQVYRGLEIVTGVADERARTRLEHRLLSFDP